jgi:(p)ppGpp synthase/HD superfamily hydrolase
MKNAYFFQDPSLDCQYSVRLLNKITSLNQTSQNLVDIKEIKKTITYTKKYHGNQKRLSGEPYYSHPLEVAYILCDYLFDTESIICALLHDIAEDTRSSIEQIAFIFGQDIANVVNTISNLTAEHKLSQDEKFYKISSFSDLNRKAIIIKVIDRLHNMRTIHHIKPLSKQKRIAKETLHFYIPLAKAANLIKIEQELSKIVVEILINS